MGTLFDEIQAGTTKEKSKIGAIRSTLAGIGSGIFKIPEGIFSLGASNGFILSKKTTHS
jgi:hypothetical protein